jgi:uncharacterized membrane protein YhhN
MRTFILTIVYFFIGTLSVVFQNQPSLFPELAVKAAIIPVLLILFLLNIKVNDDKLHRMIFMGLLFSWAGDVILEFSDRNELMFTAGLLSFMAAQYLYLTVFFKTPGRNTIFKNRIYLLIPVLIYGAVLLLLLYNDLSEMRIPVIIYAFVILTMLTGAVNRIEKVNRSSFYLVLTGAILFVISDTSIAINKFSYPFKYSGIVIMSTYIVAQYLIVTGYIKQFATKFR